MYRASTNHQSEIGIDKRTVIYCLCQVNEVNWRKCCFRRIVRLCVRSEPVNQTAGGQKRSKQRSSNLSHFFHGQSGYDPLDIFKWRGQGRVTPEFF